MPCVAHHNQPYASDHLASKKTDPLAQKKTILRGLLNFIIGWSQLVCRDKFGTSNSIRISQKATEDPGVALLCLQRNNHLDQNDLVAQGPSELQVCSHLEGPQGWSWVFRVSLNL